MEINLTKPNSNGIGDAKSIVELRDLGRLLEAKKESLDNLFGSSRKLSVLEPDIAYISHSHKAEDVFSKL